MLILSTLVLQKDRGEREEEERLSVGLCDPVLWLVFFFPQCFVFVFIHVNG